jgi:hypothetical protein
MPRPRHAALAILLASLHLACSDSSRPELPPLIGSYAATTFVLPEPGLHPPSLYHIRLDRVDRFSQP